MFVLPEGGSIVDTSTSDNMLTFRGIIDTRAWDNIVYDLQNLISYSEKNVFMMKVSIQTKYIHIKNPLKK